jgi:hypothetical protein
LTIYDPINFEGEEKSGRTYNLIPSMLLKEAAELEKKWKEDKTFSFYPRFPLSNIFKIKS